MWQSSNKAALLFLLPLFPLAVLADTYCSPKDMRPANVIESAKELWAFWKEEFWRG